MSRYEQERWAELQSHWLKKAERRQLLPPKARTALATKSQEAKHVASKAGQAIAGATPAKVKDMAGIAVDAALVPTAHAVVHLLELINDWVEELSNPKAVFEYHRDAGREVSSLDDLKAFDLKLLDEFTSHMSLRWRGLGAGQGAAFGALAMIPIPVVGSLAAITLDMVAMQALTLAIATRVCYAYGFDVADPEVHHMVERMVVRAYRNQVPKAGTVKSAGAAFNAAKGRVNWSKKLRNDHRLMAAVEKLLKRAAPNGRVPVKNARMGMPVISVLVGAGTNSHILADTAKQARYYAATMFLAEKHGLQIPANIHRDLDSDSPADESDHPQG